MNNKLHEKKETIKELLHTTRWIYHYTKQYNKYIILYTILGLVTTGISLAISLASKNLVDVITGHHSERIVRTFSIFLFLSIWNIILCQLSNYASQWISMKVDNQIKYNVFNKIMETDWESITSYHTGDLLTRWNSDASNISSSILNWIPNLVINLVKFISTLLLILYYDPTFAFLALLGIPFSCLISYGLLGRMKQQNEQSAKMNATIAGFNQETFSNLQTIKAFDLIQFYNERLKTHQTNYLNLKMKFQSLIMVTSILISFIAILVSSSCYAWGIYRVWTGSISYGTMTMFLGLSTSLSGTLNALIHLVPTAISLSTSAKRLMDIVEMPKEDSSEYQIAKELYTKKKENGFSIYLTDLEYSYKNGTTVFDTIDFEAHPHQVIALTGPSGEGKTTLLRILLALLSPTKGECYITLESNPDFKFSITASTRQFFSYVPQGNTMFSGTIAENLRAVKADATNEEMIEALKLACAWDFVQQLPNGMDTMLGERGAGLSEGQSQRLSIARALLRKSPILLLDEATSALDLKTEQLLLENIMKDDYPRTCILTTHRPAILSICTKNYHIINKKLVEVRTK